LFILFLVLPFCLSAQDTVKQETSSTIISHDTLLKTDTLSRTDTVKITAGGKEAPKKARLDSKVDYASTDSLRFEIRDQKVYLYNKADIKYEKIGLKADYVEIDFPKTMVFAHGLPDSTGKDQGVPEFSDGQQTFKSKEMNYNYKTKKGYIINVFTKQDEGYLHGSVVKKMENNVTYIQDGSYTTCEHEVDPDYEFKFGKGKVIPGKRVITGPAYMIIAQVPTPLAIPFGYFPNRAGRRSGILIPSYGESNNRGFYFENGGYYFAFNDYWDLKLIGDIYTRGSWAVKPVFSYNKRYHYSGMFNFSYAVNKIGTQDSPDYELSKDFRIRWVHTQDPKARPHSTFSANVNIVSNTFNKYNLSSSTEAYLSNTFQSSVNYTTNLANTVFLNLNFNHSQNTLNKTVEFTLPQVALSVNQFYPFRKKSRVGKEKWYEKISLKYNLDAQNNYNTIDSLLFQPGWQKDLQNGIRHTVPITGTFRILKYINWTNSINLTDVNYFSTIRMTYINVPVVVGHDTFPGYVRTDTVYGLSNAVWGNFSSSINTRLYGMFQFKGGPIIAIRHMLIPTVSFSYTPEFGAPGFGYWRRIQNDTTTVDPQTYSIFQGGIYGGPPKYKSGVLNFSLSNNLEMKVRNRKDTITGTKKIVLIENFVIGASYDLAKDTVAWSKIQMSGYTTLFKTLRIQYGSTWDPYARDSLGRRTNTSEWKAHHRLVRLDATTWDLGLSWGLTSDKAKKKKSTTKGTEQERQDIYDNYDYYVDFDIPWSFQINYNFHYTKDWVNSQNRRVDQIVQTLNFNGQLNITPKWKIGLTTGYDFIHGQLSYTSIDVYRDLHCWEMRFGWIPKGAQQSWNFSINVKASVLQDMKLNKKKDFRDFAN
jgi:lipopolysaccharide assembly outer membrane protein LptD (OstA)